MKKYVRISYLVLFILLITLSGCQMGGTYKNVTVDEAKQMIDNDDVVVLDVRTDEEYNAGHIPNSIIIPVQELDSRVDELDRDKSYLVVCRSGNRSIKASEILLNNGFSDVFNLEVGMNGWTYEVETK